MGPHPAFGHPLPEGEGPRRTHPSLTYRFQTGLGSSEGPLPPGEGGRRPGEGAKVVEHLIPTIASETIPAST